MNLNPVPIVGIYKRWLGKYQRGAVHALTDLKESLERKPDE